MMDIFCSINIKKNLINLLVLVILLFAPSHPGSIEQSFISRTEQVYSFSGKQKSNHVIASLTEKRISQKIDWFLFQNTLDAADLQAAERLVKNNASFSFRTIIVPIPLKIPSIPDELISQRIA